MITIGAMEDACGFWTFASDVDREKARLDGSFVTTASRAERYLSGGELAGWRTFHRGWLEFRYRETPTFFVRAECNQVVMYAEDLEGWQKTIAARAAAANQPIPAGPNPNPASSAPGQAPPLGPGGLGLADALSTAKWVAGGVAVVAVVGGLVYALSTARVVGKALS